MKGNKTELPSYYIERRYQTLLNHKFVDLSNWKLNKREKDVLFVIKKYWTKLSQYMGRNGMERDIT